MEINQKTMEEFTQEVVDRIKDFLPASYADYDVSVTKIAKNNVQLDSLQIFGGESNISPTIYLQGFYEDYKDGTSMTNILSAIAATRVENEVEQPFNVSKITDYSQAKDHLEARLVGIDNNESFLQGRPFTQVEDLAVVYAIDLGESKEGAMSVGVTNDIQKAWGISTEELHATAMENTFAHQETQFRSMTDVMKEILMGDMMAGGTSRESAEMLCEEMLPPDDGTMHVLTNSSKMNGAICMMNQEALDMIHEELGGDFYILPSSVHEVLVVPKDMGASVHELESMVQDVNATEVSPQDRLSDHVYAYDAETKEIYRADKEEEHQRGKEVKNIQAEQEKSGKVSEKGEKYRTEKSDREEKTSLKERMAAKKKEVGAKNKAIDAAKKAHKKDVSL